MGLVVAMSTAVVARRVMVVVHGVVRLRNPAAMVLTVAIPMPMVALMVMSGIVSMALAVATMC